jgi:hypothetical protein
MFLPIGGGIGNVKFSEGTNDPLTWASCISKLAVLCNQPLAVSPPKELICPIITQKIGGSPNGAIVLGTSVNTTRVSANNGIFFIIFLSFLFLDKIKYKSWEIKTFLRLFFRFIAKYCLF